MIENSRLACQFVSRVIWEKWRRKESLEKFQGKEFPQFKTVRKHLAVRFLCALSYLSGALCSLSALSGVRGSGKPLPGLRSKRWDTWIRFPSLVFLYSDKYPLPFYEPYGKSDCLQLSLFDKDCLKFCKSGILIFTFAENSYLVRQYIYPNHVE